MAGGPSLAARRTQIGACYRAHGRRGRSSYGRSRQRIHRRCMRRFWNVRTPPRSIPRFPRCPRARSASWWSARQRPSRRSAASACGASTSVRPASWPAISTLPKTFPPRGMSGSRSSLSGRDSGAAASAGQPSKASRGCCPPRAPLRPGARLYGQRPGLAVLGSPGVHRDRFPSGGLRRLRVGKTLYCPAGIARPVGDPARGARHSDDSPAHPPQLARTLPLVRRIDVELAIKPQHPVARDSANRGQVIPPFRLWWAIRVDAGGRDGGTGAFRPVCEPAAGLPAVRFSGSSLALCGDTVSSWSRGNRAKEGTGKVCVRTRCLSSCQRPHLKAARKCIRSATVSVAQNVLGALKRRLMTRRWRSPQAPIPPAPSDESA